MTAERSEPQAAPPAVQASVPDAPALSGHRPGAGFDAGPRAEEPAAEHCSISAALEPAHVEAAVAHVTG